VVLTAIAGASIMAVSTEVGGTSTDGVEDEILELRAFASVGDSI
jgi:hypothetical protein